MAVLNRMLAAVTLLPGAAELLRLRVAELPQRDDLCGPFTALLALRVAGLGDKLDQDDVALAAGTVLSRPPRTGSLPPREPGRDDFRRQLPQTDEPAGAGTAATGVARAVEQLTDGALAAVPASGRWDAAVLRALLVGVGALAGPVIVLANIATGELADHGASADELEGYLGTGVYGGPRSRWHAGHFVTLAGLLEGPAGTLVLVADSYRSLGVDGLHLQPVEHLAAALRRNGLPPGGILLVVPAGQGSAARELVAAAGLVAELWDNGSPDAARPPAS